MDTWGPGLSLEPNCYKGDNIYQCASPHLYLVQEELFYVVPESDQVVEDEDTTGVLPPAEKAEGSNIITVTQHR